MPLFPRFQFPRSWRHDFTERSDVRQIPEELFDRIEFALELASLASDVSLRFYRTEDYRVERKSDRSPVTAADKEAEKAVREAVERRFPSDAILGEEFGSATGTSDYEWIIDPIDGTKSFISGVPLYSTLVGMTFRGQPSTGVIAIPALGELCIAWMGGGAWYGASKGFDRDDVELRACSVSKVDSLADGLFLTSQVDNFERRQAESAYRALEKEAYVTRSWGDGYGYLLVATGRAELMVDPIVNPWDIAAVAPVILEAGGKFSSWSGAMDIRAGHCFASNGRVHEAALQVLKPYASRNIVD
jgi:histidinol phosphatase-like enzyme (inositol monophosphatase family)